MDYFQNNDDKLDKQDISNYPYEKVVNSSPLIRENILMYHTGKKY